MKIVEVDCHISVRFGVRKREERHFSSIMAKPKHPNLEFELIPQVGIRVMNDEDNVVIPFVNITAFRTEDSIKPMTAAEEDVLGLNDESEEEEQETASIGFKIKR